ncbi:MAG: exosortase-associated EpsI family protein [Chthoniobacter sp.]
MTTKRLAILLAVLLAGLGSIFLLPRQLGFQPVGINLDLPKMVGGWYGKDLEVTGKERSVLGEDKGTEFARKAYRNGIGYEIVASIVLSGEDMSRSIHRPERCMPAQGYTIIDKSTVPVALPERGTMRITRLQNVRNVPMEDGTTLASYNVTYYWFVGHTGTTSSHIVRTWLDMRDRLFYGYNQRWAYITVAAQLPQGAEQDARTQRVVDDWMKDFIKQLVPKIQKDSVKIASAN